MKMDTADIMQTWSRLVETGTPEEDLEIAGRILDELSVGIDDWIERLSRHYLAGLSRRSSHFKLVVGPYGSGKTHFLMALASRALRENYAVSFVKCRAGVSLEDPLAFYQEIVRNIRLPNHSKPGIRTLFSQVRERWKKSAKEAPDELWAWENMLQELKEDPDFPFGRVAAAYLRYVDNPSLDQELGEDAARWLSGHIGEVGKKQKETLRLGNVPKRELPRFGSELRNQLIKFVPNSGVHGLVLLIDESESMVTAKGKALTRVLNAMRTMIDERSDDFGRMPMLCVFAAIHDIRDQIEKYQALASRLKVVGKAFHDGANSAAEIDLECIGQAEDVFRRIGEKLLRFGGAALTYEFDEELQAANLNLLINVFIDRGEIDMKRLFVKGWCALLEEQVGDERRFTSDEIRDRISGVYQAIRDNDEAEEDYA